MLNSSR